jgi:gamma-glutamyltranspeptidase/glutathione hydrolase
MRLFSIILIGLIGCTHSCFSQTGDAVSGKNGMVVCSDRNASEIGLQILKKGGNAIDAAIAMSFALAVTYPEAGNIGGGGFLLYYRNDGFITSIDFREKAPLRADSAMFLDAEGKIKNNSNHEGILSAGVPGTVAGLELAHKKYGELDWKELVEPAVNLAENGFAISENLSKNFNYGKDDFLRYSSTTKAFLKKDNTAYSPGDIWRQPDLAATLKRIQKFGKEDFYNGKTAQLICEFMKNNGGMITPEDLKQYKAVERKPVHCNYRGYDVYSMGPPSSGGVVITEALNILEGFDLNQMGHNSVQYLHTLSEAMRLAFIDRARYLGDPDFQHIPLQTLCSKEYAHKLQKLILPDTTLAAKAEDVKQLEEGPHTTHLSVMDSQGNAVSLTYTIEGWFGSGMIVEGAGFLLNNEMGDFNPMPGITDNMGNIGTRPNLVAPGKRMLSSMSPTLVLKDEKPFLIIGSPGGRTIPNTVLQVVLNVIDFNMNISDALTQKRIHHQWMPDTTILEFNTLSETSLKEFQKIGHETDTGNGYRLGEAMGIMFDSENHTYFGKADPRSPDGTALGY